MKPRFQKDDEDIVIALGGPAPLLRGADEARWLDDEDEWLKACGGYRRKDKTLFRPWMVKDRKKDRDFRIWMLEPALVEDRWSVQLHARFETSDGFGSFKVFRGQHAWVTDPLHLSRPMKPIIDVIAKAEGRFDRVSVTAAVRDVKIIPWGTVSRVLAEMQNFGLVHRVGTRPYTLEDDDVRTLQDDVDSQHIVGNKVVYEKSPEWWPNLMEQWAAFLSSKEKNCLYEPPAPA